MLRGIFRFVVYGGILAGLAMAPNRALPNDLFKRLGVPKLAG